MTTINIPVSANGANPVVVFVNGVKYIIPRGTNVTVPEGVADIVAGMLDWPQADTPVNNDRILPVVSEADNGKIPRVVGGQWVVSDETVELPAVSGDDDDKVLTVVDGAWAAAELPADDSDAK